MVALLIVPLYIALLGMATLTVWTNTLPQKGKYPVKSEYIKTAYNEKDIRRCLLKKRYTTFDTPFKEYHTFIRARNGRFVLQSVPRVVRFLPIPYQLAMKGVLVEGKLYYWFVGYALPKRREAEEGRMRLLLEEILRQGQ